MRRKIVKDKGPAGHILTGPIYIEGAEPGDTLEVRIQEIKTMPTCLPASPWISASPSSWTAPWACTA